MTIKKKVFKVLHVAAGDLNKHQQWMDKPITSHALTYYVFQALCSISLSLMSFFSPTNNRANTKNMLCSYVFTNVSVFYIAIISHIITCKKTRWHALFVIIFRLLKLHRIFYFNCRFVKRNPHLKIIPLKLIIKRQVWSSVICWRSLNWLWYKKKIKKKN